MFVNISLRDPPISMQRWQSSIYSGTLEPLISSKMLFFLLKSVLFLRVSPISIASYIQEMRKSLLQRTRKETNKN